MTPKPKARKRKVYAIKMWCPDCYGEDPQGCFDGGSEILDARFETRAEAEKVGDAAILESIHRYKVIEMEEES